MNALQLDPKTGYLESRNPQGNGFTAERKVRFVELCHETITNGDWPSIEELGEAINVAPSSIYDHLKVDPLLKQQWKEIKTRLSSFYTKTLASKARLNQGTIANLAILKYLETGSWLQNLPLNPSQDNGPTKQLISQYSGAIDAEIVVEADKSGDIEPINPVIIPQPPKNININSKSVDSQVDLPGI